MKNNAFKNLPLIKIPEKAELYPKKEKEELKGEYIQIKDIYIIEFLRHLTVSKVYEFMENCKIKQLESLKRNMKLKKTSFINLMIKTFLLKGEIFEQLYEQIFNRFKIYKAELTCINKKDNYFLNKITPNDEIDIYEICCALACLVKCDFQQKIKLLFDITDIDDDGYINERELKKLIYTINNLFCDESNNNESTIISQSIASINSTNTFRKLMNLPGELGKIFHEQKYINFNQFLHGFIQLYNYKYDVIPLYINLKKCLTITKKEKVYEIKQRNLNDYSEISNEIITHIKTDSGIGESNIDFKKNLTKKKIPLKLKHYISKITLDSNNELSNNKHIENPKLKEELYSTNFNKIQGLEAYPGRIKIIENNKLENIPVAKSSSINNFKKAVSKLLNNEINKKQGYFTFNEIINEIETISNKHKADEQIPEQMLLIEKEICDEADFEKRKLRDKNPNEKLQFGLINRKNKLKPLYSSF